MGIFFRNLGRAFEILHFQWEIVNNSCAAEGARVGFLISRAYFFFEFIF